MEDSPKSDKAYAVKFRRESETRFGVAYFLDNELEVYDKKVTSADALASYLAAYQIYSGDNPELNKKIFRGQDRGVFLERSKCDGIPDEYNELDKEEHDILVTKARELRSRFSVLNNKIYV